MHIIEIGILASPAKKNNKIIIIIIIVKKPHANNSNKNKENPKNTTTHEWFAFMPLEILKDSFDLPGTRLNLFQWRVVHITKILPQSKPISIRKFNEMGEYTVWVPKWTILLNDNETQTKNDAHINANRMYSNRCWNVCSWESNQNTELIWNGIKITCKIKRTYWKPFLTLDPRSDIFDIPNRLKHEIDFLFSVMYSSLYFGVKQCSEICIMHTVRISCIRFLYMNHFSNVICLTVCT